jgi:GDSL-like lipase/acylhydrolase family protein
VKAPDPARRARAKHLLLTALSASAGLLVAELALAQFAPQYRNYTRPDDLLGYAFVPGARYTVAPAEGCPGWGSSGRINTLGLRDRERDRQRPPGTFRILALGDSYTEGFQFDLNRIWPGILEQRLNRRGESLRYEVINAGRSAMGTGTELLNYRREGREYDADVVVLLFVPNDFRDNSRALSGRPQAYFTLTKGGIALDTSFVHTFGYRLRKAVQPLKRSMVVSLAAQRYQESTARRYAGTSAGSNWPTALRPAELDAVEVTRRLLLTLAREVSADGARLVVVMGTDDFEVNGIDAPVAAVHDPLTSAADSIVSAAVREAGIPFLNLEPIFREYSARHHILLHGCAENRGEGHWNETGHALAAAAIYDFLAVQGLVP